MFKLKFFILFALAGLCFGDTSPSETGASSSDGEAGSEPAGSETVDQTSEGKDGSGDIQKSKSIGDHLPDFIGTNQDKVSYLNRLLSVCNKKHNLRKINKVNITFELCTFVCLSESVTGTNQEERIPTDLVCNSNKDKCPKEGSCPTPPLPSC
uniref:Salivary gland 16 kD protein n=1 Tax=Ixodes scapularis TaxID=6945 RepID=Q9GR10_IXOSC|nr:salivary gland 16 kD protein [Ixodes scapularis]